MNRAELSGDGVERISVPRLEELRGKEQMTEERERRTKNESAPTYRYRTLLAPSLKYSQSSGSSRTRLGTGGGIAGEDVVRELMVPGSAK